MKKIARYCKLRIAMMEKQYSQEEISQMIGRSPSYISRCMSGRTAFHLSEAYCICDVLGIPHDQLHIYFPPDGITVKQEGIA